MKMFYKKWYLYFTFVTDDSVHKKERHKTLRRNTTILNSAVIYFLIVDEENVQLKHMHYFYRIITSKQYDEFLIFYIIY